MGKANGKRGSEEATERREGESNWMEGRKNKRKERRRKQMEGGREGWIIQSKEEREKAKEKWEGESNWIWEG